MTRATTEPTRRERQRQATMAEIVTVSRELLKQQPGGLSLRAVAQRMGITAPALYRYVGNYQELVDLVAFDIDGDATRLLEAAAARHPVDDPAARIISAAIAFRRWALTDKEEFTLVFANPLSESTCITREQMEKAQSGHFFTGLLVELWLKYRFPLPDVDQLEPAVGEVLRDPVVPADLASIPEDAHGLVWLFMRSWAALYGTVTLEVFGHVDPRIIDCGAMFRAMLEDQATALGISEEMPRLRKVILAEMAR